MTNSTHRRLAFAGRLLGGAAMAVLAFAVSTSAQAAGQEAKTASASAQAADQDGKSSDASDKSQEGQIVTEVVVTGTNIAGVKPVGSKPVVIDKEEILRSGLSNPSDLVRVLPQAQISSANVEGGTPNQLGNGSQGTALDLRGLGPAATLTLLDGRRVVSGGANSTFTEANLVPLAAIARIEVITDGSSAIYGSDAVAGVVNFVLRKDFEGVEANLRLNNQSGGTQKALDVTAGTTWDKLGGLGAGNILMTYEHAERDAYLAGKKDYLRQDTSQFGGPDLRLQGGTISVGVAPNIVVPIASGVPNPVSPRSGANTYYGLPIGSNVGLSAAALRANQPNLRDYSDYTDYIGKQNRDQASVFFSQELNSALELFGQGFWFDRSTRSRYGTSGTQIVQLPAFLTNAAGAPTATPNPYYISGVPGVAPGAPLAVTYTTLKDIGPQIYAADTQSYGVTLGLRANLPGSWRGEAFYNYGRNKACDYCVPNQVNAAALQRQINLGLINPLSSEPLSEAQIATFVGQGRQRSKSGMDDFVVKFNGPLFDVAAGPVRAAFGLERNKISNANQNSANTGADNAVKQFTTYDTSRYSRTVWSGFAEVNLPIVSPEMNLPLVKSLTGSAAVRYDDYSDVDSATSPKLGFTWDVDGHFALAGTWGKSYRAPSVTDRNPQAYSSGSIVPLPNKDPRVTNGFLNFPPFYTLANVALIFGSNPDMQPERSTNWSLSGSYRNGGFNTTVSYYSIDYRDRITFPAVFNNYLAGNNPPVYAGYGQFVIPIHNPATCSNSDISTADPKLQPFLRSNPLYTPGATVSSGSSLANFCSVNVVLDSRFTNLAREKQSGLDISVGYFKPVGDVLLNASLAATVVLDDNVQVQEGAAWQGRAGHAMGTIKWRGRGSLGATWRDFSSTLYVNYVGSYLNDLPVDTFGVVVPAEHVEATTSYDLSFAYNARFTEPKFGMIKGVRASASVLNVFDKKPPIVHSTGGVVDSAAAANLIFGRTFALQLGASF